MSTFVEDSFTDTGGTALENHTPETGGAWEDTTVNNHGTISNGISIDTGGTYAQSEGTDPSPIFRNAANPNGAQYYVEGTMKNLGGLSEDDWDLIARCDPTGTASLTYYYAGFRGNNNTHEIAKVVSGSTTQLASGSFTSDDGDVLRFMVTDDAKIMFGQGSLSEMLVTTDNAITQDGRAGFGCPNSSRGGWADFKAETLDAWVVGSDIVGTGSGNNAVLSLPGTTQEGDIVLTFGALAWDGNPNYAIPTGYTLIDDFVCGADVGYIAAARKEMGATPDSSVTWVGSTNSQDASIAGFYVIRGADPNTPLDVTPTKATGNNTVPTLPAITTVTDKALVFALNGQVGAGDVRHSTTVPPAGYTGIESLDHVDTDSAAAHGAWKYVDPAGTEDPGEFGQQAMSDARTWWASFTIAIKPRIVAPLSNSWVGVRNLNDISE